MQITIIAVGTSLANWVNTGFETYAKRLSQDFNLKLVEIKEGKRGKGCDLKKIINREGEQMIAAIPQQDTIIALDVLGKSFSTELMAKEIKKRQLNSENLSLLIGGPEGLAPICLERADAKWSLSSLTLPHPLVRIVVAEQIYRVWSLLNNHPYHR